jgi:putative aldouronate transport system permease protein
LFNIEQEEKMTTLTVTNQKEKRRREKRVRRKRNRPLHIMMLPAVLLLFVFNYIPMVGLLMAFQDFQPKLGAIGLIKSPWAGLKYFKQLFLRDDFMQTLYNTVNISFMKLVFMFIVPLIIALLFNEVHNMKLKRTIQTIVYIPHFISWVILAGILKEVLGLDGLLNNIITSMGFEQIFFLGTPSIFPAVLVSTDVWKEFGFSTIIFLAAITGVDPVLYEAAQIDGAGRMKQVWHVTLPGIRNILILCIVISLGGILNAGFEQILLLGSAPVASTGEVIDTLVYRVGLGKMLYSLSTAFGLFKSVIALILVSLSYWLAKKFANYTIF